MIAVTGASGYIGRATLRRLALSYTSAVAIVREPPKFALPNGVDWYATGNTPPLPDAFAGCSSVIHLAGRAHIQSKKGSAPQDDLFDHANHRLAIDTAIAARDAGVQRFVFVSTIGVHGNWSDQIIDASSPLRPDTPYARSKHAAERELADICAKSGMELCVVRPTMVYGPNSPGNFSRLLKLVSSEIPLPFGSLHAVRSFIHVDNLASFLETCAVHLAPAANTYVISDGSNWSTTQLVSHMTSALGRPSRAFPFPIRAFRPLMIPWQREIDSLTRPMLVDTTKAWEDLKWKPQIDPEQGLKDAVLASSHPHAPLV